MSSLEISEQASEYPELVKTQSLQEDGRIQVMVDVNKILCSNDRDSDEDGDSKVAEEEEDEDVKFHRDINENNEVNEVVEHGKMWSSGIEMNRQTSSMIDNNVIPYSEVKIKNSTDVHIGSRHLYNGQVTMHIHTISSVIDKENKIRPMSTHVFNDNENGKYNYNCFKGFDLPCKSRLSNDASNPLYPRKHRSVIEGFCIKRRIFMSFTVALALIAAVTITSFIVTVDKTDNLLPSWSQNYSSINNGSFSSNTYKFVSRQEWDARPPLSTPRRLKWLPAYYIIVSHTATEYCLTTNACSQSMRHHQDFDISRGLEDVRYNFVVGGDGAVYEGRGWDIQGEHTNQYNEISLGIGFIGNYNVDTLNAAHIEATLILFEQGVKLGKLAKDYKMVIDYQIITTDNPGKNLMDVVKTWQNWFPYGNPGYIIERTGWRALEPTEQSITLPQVPASFVIIGHVPFVSYCKSLIDCIIVNRMIQNDHMFTGNLSDIAYNFLVGADGMIYESRGWDVVGDHTDGYNNNSVGIAFIGNYNRYEPTKDQTTTVNELLNRALEQNKLTTDYIIYGQRQVLNHTNSPGDKLYKIVKTLNHWRNIGKN